MAEVVDPQFEIIEAGPCRYRKLILNEVLAPGGGNNPDAWDDEMDCVGEELDMVFEGDSWVFRLNVPRFLHKCIQLSEPRCRRSATESRKRREGITKMHDILAYCREFRVFSTQSSL